MPDVTYYILRRAGEPVEADRLAVETSWPEEARSFTRSALEVAPGIWVKFIAWGDHWQPSLGASIHGALIAVSTDG